MRILVYFTAGFAAACGLSAYVLQNTWLLLCMLICLLAVAVCLLLRTKASRIAMVLAIGAFAGFYWMQLYQDTYLSRLERFDNQTVTATVEITDYSYETYNGIAASGKIELEGKSYKLRLYVDDHDALCPGDRLEGRLLLQATTAGGAAESDYYQGNGLFLVGYVEAGSRLTKASDLQPAYYPVALRKAVLEQIDRCFPQDTLAFARALLLGDTGGLTYGEDTAYKLSGIRHVVAVSGLHVSILFSMLYMLAGKKRFATAVLGIPGLLLFAAVVGFTPSVLRACGMQLIMILALLLNKDYDPPTALAASVLLILVISPMSIYSVSFQLSAGCMVGIFLFCQRLQEWILSGKLGKHAKGKGLLARVIRWCAGTVSVTLSAMFVTTPLCAFYFGVISLVGILTNLLCLWAISAVFYGIMLSCALGAVWLSGGQAVAAGISLLIRMVQLISKGLAAIPFGAVYTRSGYIVAWLAVSYAALILFLLAKNKRPLLLSCSIVLSLFVAIGASRAEPVVGGYLVTVLDVGQGQAVHLRCGTRNYLVDCGSTDGEIAADAAASSLLSQGITRLDGVIVTHYDADHVNGVEMLLSRISVQTLYLPDVADDTGFRAALEATCPDRIVWVRQDFRLSRDDWSISVFTGELGKEGNESSLSVLFQREKCDILITGDRSARNEGALLDRIRLPQLELLVTGHHGSDSSTSMRLLWDTRPAAAAISVGADNYYNLPAQQTLDRLQWADCRILRTDLQGDIHFRR